MTLCISQDYNHASFLTYRPLVISCLFIAPSVKCKFWYISRGTDGRSDLAGLDHFTKAWGAAVIGIDYGGEWVKTAIVRTGQPIGIVLNENTKRKVSTSVGICGDKLHVSDDARSMETRMPNCVFTYSRDLLGQKYGTVMNSTLSSRHLFDILERGTVVLSDGTKQKKESDSGDETETEPEYYTAEEISAFLLDAIRKYSEVAVFDGDVVKASAEHERIVRDCVISVPSHFDVFQRQAIYDAAELAGLNVLGLVNDHLAASLQYLVSGRVKTTSELPSFKFWEATEVSDDANVKNEVQSKYDIQEIREHLPNTTEPVIMMFDMGSTETQVSIVKFTDLPFNVVPPAMRADEILGIVPPSNNKEEPKKDKPKDKDKQQTLGQIEVLAVSSDNDLGGYSFDVILADHLKKAFLAKYPTAADELNSNTKALVRLRREANRAKHILSANENVRVNIDTLLLGKDLDVVVTRREFEEISAELLRRTMIPLENALKYANLTSFDLWAVELIGGSSRVPMVKRAIREYLGRSSLDHKLDGDECIAMGSAFYGAILSSHFRAADVKMRDIHLDDVIIDINGTQGKDKNISTVVVSAGTKIPTKKRVRLERSEDMIITLSTMGRNIESYNVTGIQDALVNKSDAVLDVNVTVKVASDGITFVSAAEAKMTIEEKVCPNDTVTTAAPAVEKTKSDDDDESELSETKPEPTLAVDAVNATSENVTECTTKTRSKVVPLNLSRLFASDIPPLTEAMFQASRGVIRMMERREKKRLLRAEALNSLEALLYETRDIIYDDEHEIQSFITQEEKDKLMTLLSETGTWLEDNSETGSMTEFKEAHSSLSSMIDKFKKRLKESKSRPLELKELQSTLNISKTLADKWTEEIEQRLVLEKLEEEAEAARLAAAEAAKQAEAETAQAEKTESVEQEVKPEETHDQADDSKTKEKKDKPKEKKKPKKPAVPYMQMWEVDMVKTMINDTSVWLETALIEQVTEDPTLLTSEIKRKREKIENELMYLLRKKTMEKPPSSKSKKDKEKSSNKEEL